MYTHEDLLKTYNELKEVIATTEITEEVFVEIEEELKKLVSKQHIVKNQISELVAEANHMCKLHKQVQGYVNGLYTDLKAKQLTDQGVDLSSASTANNYDSFLSHQLTYGDFFKVEMKNTMV